jgi:hypothetical protein
MSAFARKTGEEQLARKKLKKQKRLFLAIFQEENGDYVEGVREA